MKALFKQYPFRSQAKFVPIAVDHGFTKNEAKQFLKQNVAHDKRYTVQRHLMRPIYSNTPGAYQFDTLVQSKSADPPYYLIAVNVNTRKAYAYPMKSKDSSSVLRALTSLSTDTNMDASNPESQGLRALTSDQDAAYLTQPILSFMTSHNIDYRTTQDHDHNRLAIINRFIRTLRDLNGNKRDLSESKMIKLLKAYNDTIHSSTQKVPSKMTNEDEKAYIDDKREETDIVRLMSHIDTDSTVRVMNPRNSMKKRRRQLTIDTYQVASSGANVLLKAADDSVATIPRHRLHLAPITIATPLAKTLDDAKRGVVNKILDIDHKAQKCRVEYEGGVKEWIPLRNLREGRPTYVTPMERQFIKRT